ncbi:beta-ketoacyl synthase [Aspergillus pseudodeflectus]|uniref:Beta-ketoacyl synthase n=1 Tax=Aspergillus pseudodeflectus TaxID=176178 RepID=A0ABR4KD37_9EURO
MAPHQASNVEPIALVGMACRFPGDATDTTKFWQMLYKGESAWSEVPESRFNANAFHHPDSNRNGTFHTHGGHFLKQDVSVFDAPFFGITPSEARAMDPQLRLLLEVAFESGPIQQVLTEVAPSFLTTKFVYASPLIRNKAATTTALSFAGELFCNGIALDLRAVNFPSPRPRPHV